MLYGIKEYKVVSSSDESLDDYSGNRIAPKPEYDTSKIQLAVISDRDSESALPVKSKSESQNLNVVTRAVDVEKAKETIDFDNSGQMYISQKSVGAIHRK